jgi:hypothetical protein
VRGAHLIRGTAGSACLFVMVNGSPASLAIIVAVASCASQRTTGPTGSRYLMLDVGSADLRRRRAAEHVGHLVVGRRARLCDTQLGRPRG